MHGRRAEDDRQVAQAAEPNGALQVERDASRLEQDCATGGVDEKAAVVGGDRRRTAVVTEEELHTARGDRDRADAVHRCLGDLERAAQMLTRDGQGDVAAADLEQRGTADVDALRRAADRHRRRNRRGDGDVGVDRELDRAGEGDAGNVDGEIDRQLPGQTTRGTWGDDEDTAAVGGRNDRVGGVAQRQRDVAEDKDRGRGRAQARLLERHVAGEGLAGDRQPHTGAGHAQVGPGGQVERDGGAVKGHALGDVPVRPVECHLEGA